MRDSTKRAARRLKLFQDGAKALSVIDGAMCEQYVCPLCCRIFAVSDVEQGALRLEHAQPGKSPVRRRVRVRSTS
jgi:hypothetical protein